MVRMNELSLHDSVLKDWDISFQISGESLLNILEFCKDINYDILFRFRKEEIIIHQKSDDNTQYFEIVIPWNDVSFYNCNIEDTIKTVDNAKAIDSAETIDNEKIKEKLVCINIKKLSTDLGNFIDKSKPVDVIIDTKKWKRVQFSANNTACWVQTIDPDDISKKLENMPGIIAKQRALTSVPVGIIQIEPLTLSQICKLGPTGKKSADDDSKLFIELIPNKGLIISSGGKLSGRIFKIPVEVYDEKTGDSITKQTNIEGDIVQEAINEITGIHGSLSIDNVGKSQESSGEGIYTQGEDIYTQGEDIYDGGYEGFGDRDDEYYSGQSSLLDDIDKRKQYKKRKEIEGKRDKEKIKDEDKKIHQEHQLLQWDVPKHVSVYFHQEYLSPFVKLKGTSPVVIEIRTNRPIVLTQRIFNDVRALLTIAPRMESDDE